MSKEPLVPLRWYELLMLRLLASSPRIERIMVEQVTPEPDFIRQLEELYQAPSAEDMREG